jgi:hypothetical protein
MARFPPKYRLAAAGSVGFAMIGSWIDFRFAPGRPFGSPDRFCSRASSSSRIEPMALDLAGVRGAQAPLFATLGVAPKSAVIV